MKHTLTHFILVLLFLFPGAAIAQVQQTQSENRNEPTVGVPGACGYNANQHGGNQTPQNGNGTLGVIFDMQKCGLDFTSASQRLGKRFTPQGVNQPAPFAISGIPACAVIERAYLWAEGSGNGAAQTATIAGPFGTQSFPMTVVGSGQDKCWGYAGTRTYRADVTAVVGGNGTYNISGILTNPPTAGNDMDGATLLVIWSVNSATWAGRLVIADGAIVMIGGNTTYNMPINPAVCGVTNTGKAFMGVGDIQFNPTSWSANGTAIPLGWNWWDFRQVNTTVANGQTTSAFNVNSGGDCYNLCIAGLYFRTTTCTTCPSSTALTVTPASTPATCSACNGSASVSVSPAGSYTYSWAPSGGTGSTATGLCAGVYTVTITSSCIVQTQTVNVPTSGGTLTVTGSQTNVGCFGQCTGSATTTVSGGTAPYTFSWSPAATNSTVGSTNTGTNLCAGTYIVTVTDAGGCTGSRTVTITQPPVITVTGSQTNIQCNGQCTGSATVTASGGTGTYTYAWSPTGGTGASATGLCAGTYTCTITSGPAGCTATQTFNITQVPAITATQTQTNVTCFGLCNGSASVVASGGTGSYTYAWSPSGGSAASATGLCAGTYTCTITSGPAGCTITQTFNITQPPGMTLTPSQTNILCNGQCTGSASVTATGGPGTYSYAWAPSGGTGASVTGLCAGNYTVTVTANPGGCTATQTYSITQPPALSASITSTNVLCNGGSTGSSSVSVSGGSGTYTYDWAPGSPAGDGTNTITGLAAGSYSVTVTDANGCTITQSITITQPSALSATTSFTQATCGSSNGSAAVIASGGAGSYTYTWSPVGGNSATATGLPSGPYTCLITDANGCTYTASVTVPNAGSPTATITSQTNVSCYGGNDGSATVSATGGTSPYGYSWSPSGGNAPTGTPLTAGPYTVTVTDANGCSATATVTITEPPQLTATATGTAVLCFGGSTGSASVTATGGTGTYTYAWSPSGGSNANATGLPAGPYSCLVTDQNGCTTTAAVNITEPTALTATASFTPVSCNGGSDGTATTTATGGTGTYTYSWSPTGGSAATATGLTAQPYTCLVTDQNGCTFTASVTVTQPPVLAATTSFTQATCGASNGSASVNVTGGTPAYVYQWSPSGGTGPVENNIAAGVYTCLITDSKGCTLTMTVTVLNASSPSVTIVATDSVSCNAGSDGFIAVTTTGGTTPYNYLWSNGDTDSLAGNLSAGGPYSVTVTDANGCTSTTSGMIGEPPLLTVTATSTDVLCFGGNTGTATATAGGGTGSYTYNWAPSGGSSASATGLSQGIYTIDVTDANGCMASTNVTVSEPPLLTLTASFTPATCNGYADGTASASAAGGFGSYSFMWTPGNDTNATATGLQQGAYTCVVTDQNGCTATASTTVTEPTAVVVTTTAVDAHCNQNDGSVSSNGTGGTGTLTYQWINSGGPATFDWNSIPSGTYSVIVTDANGCTGTASQVVQNLNGVTAVLNTATNLTCFQSNDGFIDVDANGGTLPYTYNWTPGGPGTDVASNLAAGSYVVIVSDAAGCTSTVSVIITEPPLLTVQATANPSAVCLGTPVQLSATASGGTPAYTYTWMSTLIGQNQTITPTTTTPCPVTVTDANGCTASATVTVTVNPMPVSDFVADDTAGCSPVCVNFSDLSTLASGTITGWLWDFGDQTTSTQQTPPLHCYSIPGPYTVVLTVTTNAGCPNTLTIANYINVSAMPVAAFGASPQPTTILDPVIHFTDSSINAASWLWSFGDMLPPTTSTDQNPTFEYTAADCYAVVLEVTSSDGCMDTATDVICIDPDVTIYVPNTFTPDDNGMNDVFIPVAIGIDENEFEMWIFDRWGNMIFYTDELYEGWDGRVQGSSDICQVDTYVWKIKCKDILGKRHDLIGHVNLIK